MNILLFLAVLVALIVVHEWGHFLAARFFGIKVEEFGVGYPPRAWTLGKWGDTTYTINWLPFGGFVKIFGESLGEEVKAKDREQALVTQAWWKQAIVFIAGVSFNLLFAWILFASSFMMGAPVAVSESEMTANAQSNNTAVLAISGVLPNSPADVAGLKPGDTLETLIAGNDILKTPVPSQVSQFISSHAGQKMQVFYKRPVAGGNNVPGNVEIIPSHGVLGDKQGTPAIGISMALISGQKQGFVDSIVLGAKRTVQATKMIAVGTGQFIKSAVLGKADWQTVAGPIGIVGLVGDASSLGLIHLMNFTAMISVNLAIINMIPVPALDGGRFLFVLIEGITKRKIPSSIAGTLNIVGFAAIILLMVVITYHDIVKIVF